MNGWVQKLAAAITANVKYKGIELNAGWPQKMATTANWIGSRETMQQDVMMIILMTIFCVFDNDKDQMQ